MTAYLIRRFLQSIGFILVVWLVIYTLLVYIMPSGPKSIYRPGMPADLTFNGVFPHDNQLGRVLDKPWPLSFFAWLFDPANTTETLPDDTVVPKGINIGIGGLRLQGAGMLTGDFGISSNALKGRRVAEVVGERWMNTATLVGLSLLVALLFAVPLGIIAAVRQRSWVDHSLTFFSFMGFSLPPFSLGVLLIMLFAVGPYLLHSNSNWNWLPYLPAGEMNSLGQENNIANHIQHLILPITTLALPQIAWLSRHVRFSMLEVLKLDYIRTAYAKGLPVSRIVLKHAFRNALIPIITSIGLAVPVLISSAIMVETVFGFPGLGQVFFAALGGVLAPMEDAEPGIIKFLDYPMTLALMFIVVVVVAISNLLADVFYTAADPRISYGAKKA